MMRITRNHMKPLGFKGTHVFDSMWQAHWYRVFPKERVIIGLSVIEPCGVFRYDLTHENLRRFQRGDISLKIPGCVAGATGHKYLSGYKWVHEGGFKRFKALLAVLASTGLFPDIKVKTTVHVAKPARHRVPRAA